MANKDLNFVEGLLVINTMIIILLITILSSGFMLYFLLQAYILNDLYILLFTLPFLLVLIVNFKLISMLRDLGDNLIKWKTNARNVIMNGCQE